MIYDLVVIGAGAAGCFAAIRLAEFQRNAKIILLEAARKPLSKVEISGGGRCNVTHACYDPGLLSTFYPRGQNELMAPFRIFQPADMIKWFASRGIALKTEADGRVFPVTDRSSTIIDCFLREMKKHGIQLRVSARVIHFHFDQSERIWITKLMNGETLRSKFLLISTGSDQRIWNTLTEMDYQIVAPVPSLFTFNIPDKELQSLMGISMEDVTVSIPAIPMETSGPLLITHWGLSGPAILKLSAWAARELNKCGYVFDIKLNWLGGKNLKAFQSELQEMIRANPKKYIHNLKIEDFPARLWIYLCKKAQIGEFTSGAEFGKKQFAGLSAVLTGDHYRATGKSTYKEEFVTAGGVDLDQIDLSSFASRKHPGLFMAGEVLNIDALTGGFNFQAAWTEAHIAAKTIADKIGKKKN